MSGLRLLTWFRTSVCLLLTAVIAGCGPDVRTNEPATELVSGRVTFDGKPLLSGRVQFIDADQTPPREYVLDIVDGKFSGQVSAGKKRVEIRAFREVSAASVGGAPTDDDPQYLPPRYNIDSELLEDIAVSGNNEFNFELSSGD